MRCYWDYQILQRRSCFETLNLDIMNIVQQTIKNNRPKISWKAAEILGATKGILLSGEIDRFFLDISIDSRNISAGDFFVAIKGAVHDGHNFANDLIKNGISGVLINKNNIKCLPCLEWVKKGVVCIAVDDTTKALGDLAAFNRKRSEISVAAITGSNGKTTTREMTSSILSRRFCVLSTRGNFNNEIGLPLTLFRLKRCHKWAVLELGMNSPGEIGRLANICSPDIGVITNIGPAHLEGLGSIEAVMNAKGELLGEIEPVGTAVLNADDPYIMQLAKRTSKNIFFYGLSEKADVKADSIKRIGQKISFILVLPEEKISISFGAAGNFMVSNALAAASVGYLLGLPAGEIKAGLEDFKPVEGRMNIFKTSRKIHIIDDTYNANPASMEAAVKTLSSLKEKSRGVFVAGDMLELGDYAEAMHKRIGSLIAEYNVSRLYITGEFAKSVSEGAMAGGMHSDDIFIGTKDEIVGDLTYWVRPDDWILVKGSRGMAMGKIVEDFKKWSDSS